MDVEPGDVQPLEVAEAPPKRQHGLQEPLLLLLCQGGRVPVHPAAHP